MPDAPSVERGRRPTLSLLRPKVRTIHNHTADTGHVATRSLLDAELHLDVQRFYSPCAAAAEHPPSAQACRRCRAVDNPSHCVVTVDRIAAAWDLRCGATPRRSILLHVGNVELLARGASWRTDSIRGATVDHSRRTRGQTIYL